MEREKDKAGLVSETFEASLGKRMVVHLRPPNHLREGSSSLPLTIVRRCTTSSSASKSASTGQAQAQDKHKHSTSTSTSTSNGQAQAKCNSHQKPKCTKSTFSRTFWQGDLARHLGYTSAIRLSFPDGLLPSHLLQETKKTTFGHRLTDSKGRERILDTANPGKAPKPKVCRVNNGPSLSLPNQQGIF